MSHEFVTELGLQDNWHACRTCAFTVVAATDKPVVTARLIPTVTEGQVETVVTISLTLQRSPANVATAVRNAAEAVSASL